MQRVATLNDDRVATKADENGTRDKAHFRSYIREVQEPRFVAHRHWNLQDAMFYSDYVAMRMRDTEPDSSFGASGPRAAQPLLRPSSA